MRHSNRTINTTIGALLFSAVLLRANAAEKSSAAAAEDFSAVTQAMVKLLETGDAAAFAKKLSPSLEDWQAAQATNHVSQKSLAHNLTKLENNSRELLAKATALKVDFSKLKLTAQPVPPKWIGGTRYEGMKDSLPWTEKLEIIVSAEPSSRDSSAERFRGDYKLTLRGLIKFPTGWRCNDGIMWMSFPTNVVDEKTQREMAILNKASNDKGITQAEDPAMSNLAEVLGQFIRERDLKIFETEALMSLDTLLAADKKDAANEGDKATPRAAMEKGWKGYVQGMGKSARATLAVLEEAGVNLEDADIKVKTAEFKSLYPRSGPGTVEGLEGNGLQVTFTVKSDAKSKTGKSLSGDYVLGAEEAVRREGRWFIMENLYWKKFPPGVLDEKAAAAVEFESYIAENNTLPPGATAPDIEFVRLSDEQKMKLADLRGKVVVVDFWATWCGPCQGPMAELQTLRASHPGWSNRVELVSLSIDDTLKKVRGHVDQRGWTNTCNVWAGPGGWKAGPPQKFRVTGVPTCYVIDAEGKIVVAGHPMGLQVAERVDELLARPGPKP